MHGREFSELRAFVAVAEQQNFGRAAGKLGLMPSTMSQTIGGLEERLGVRLFNRTTRSVSLTDAGERLLARVRPALTELVAAVEDLNDFRDTPAGTLRLSISSIAAQTVLAPALRKFLEAYPAISLDVTVDDNESDIVGGRFDAGIRIGRRIAKDMQMLRVSEPSRLIAMASPAYLSSHSAPVSPTDLQRHACVRLRNNGRIIDWEFQKGQSKVDVSVNGPLTVDNMELMVRAALEGVGIGYAMELHIADHIAAGRLVPLLLDWSVLHHSYYLYYSGRGHLPLPLTALIAFFRDSAASSQTQYR
jgi:DNA-binding transcriptional LysR family regulator